MNPAVTTPPARETIRPRRMCCRQSTGRKCGPVRSNADSVVTGAGSRFRRPHPRERFAPPGSRPRPRRRFRPPSPESRPAMLSWYRCGGRTRTTNVPGSIGPNANCPSSWLSSVNSTDRPSESRPVRNTSAPSNPGSAGSLRPSWLSSMKTSPARLAVRRNSMWIRTGARLNCPFPAIESATTVPVMVPLLKSRCARGRARSPSARPRSPSPGRPDRSSTGRGRRRPRGASGPGPGRWPRPPAR